MSPARPPRIVISGLGQYGSLIARLAVSKGWPIVAAFNRAGPKVGQDLGRVVGLNRDLGIIVQDGESGDYEGLAADIGVVTQRDLLSANMATYRRLVNAGLNIACHGSQSYLPQSNDPVLAAEIDALARKNGVTFTGCGIWDMSRIWSGILTAGPCTEIATIHHSSLTDPQGQVKSIEPLKHFCFNQPPEDFYDKGLDKDPILLARRSIPELVMRGIGYTIAESTVVVEPVVFDVPVETFYVPEGYFEPGVCVGVRSHARVTSREGVVVSATIEQRMFLPGDIEHMYWEVDGTPRNRTRVERLDSADATAGNLFNRIPDIIAAPPGIVPVSDLGPIKSTASRWPGISA